MEHDGASAPKGARLESPGRSPRCCTQVPQCDARLRALPPRAVLGPAFMPGRRTQNDEILVPRPFTGVLDGPALAKRSR